MPAHRKQLHIKGSNLWYLVGLIASDGCLSSDGRHIDITSKEYEFLSKIEYSLSLKNKIGVKNRHRINEAYHIQISNKNLYEFLLSIGLTPNKSLTLNDLKIPKGFFVDFLRGLIDGDGCICKWTHPSNNGEQWSLRIYSGSRRFLEWLQNRIEEIMQIQGRFYSGGPTQFRLKYGKMAAKEILNKCYYKDSLSLDRKAKLAQECCLSRVGWRQSKTVLN